MESSEQTVDTFQFIKGREWQLLSPGVQDEYIERAFRFWRRQGFPYPSYGRSEIQEKFDRLAAIRPETILLPNNELQFCSLGLDLANSFQPQMWSVHFPHHRSPLQCFHDDDLLRACLRQALSLWPERKGASPSVLRDMLRTFRHTRRVSNFRPTVAKAVCELYSAPAARILDFSAGYGGRLLGCPTLERHCVGCDPCALQIHGLRRMYETISGLGLTAAWNCMRHVLKMRWGASLTTVMTWSSPARHTSIESDIRPSFRRVMFDTLRTTSGGTVFFGS